MTVASETNKSGPYNGNGVTTAFDYEFRIVNEDHVRVILTDDEGNETTLTKTTHYTVAGVGSTNGGQILMVTPPATGEKLTLLRNVPFVQETDLENQGAYNAEDVEDALDLAVMRDGQMNEELSRAVKVPASDDGSTLNELVTDILRLGDSADEIDTVAGAVANVNTVAGSIASVNTVAGIATNVVTVAGLTAEVSSVAAIDDEVVEVAGIAPAVVSVAAIDDDVSTVAGISDEVVAVAAGAVVKPTPDSFVGDGSDTTFTLSAAAQDDSDVIVWLDAVRQRPTVDYTVDGTTLTFATAPDNLAAIDTLVISVVSPVSVVTAANTAIASAATAVEAAEDATEIVTGLVLASQAEAEDGTSGSKIMSPLRTRQAIAAQQSAASPELNDIAPDTAADSSVGINGFSIGNKRVSYGAGTWQADLEPWDGMVFEGVGKGRTILEAYTTDFAIPFENVENVILRDLTLRGFGALQFLTGTCRNVTLQNVGIDFGIYGLSTTIATDSINSSPLAIIEDLRVLDCEFSDLTAAAARLDCIMQNAWFERNHVHDIEGGGRLVGGFRVGLDGDLTDEQFLAQRNVFFTSNVIEDCNNTTKTGDSTPGNNFELFGIQGMGRKIVANGNIIRRVQGVIYDNEALYTKAMMAVVNGNLIEDSGSDEAAINIKGFSEADADQPDGRFFQCNNNVVRYTEYTVDGQALVRSGIQIANEAAQCNGNIVEGANGNGMVIQGPTENAGNYKDINANENIIRSHLGQIGIRLRGGYERVSVDRNKISWGALVASTGVHAGIYVESVAGNRGVSYDMFEIWDNHIDMTDLTLSGSATASGIEALIEYPYNSVKIGGGFINVATGSSADRAVYIKDDRANDIIEKMYLGDIDMLGSQIVTIESGVLVEHFTMHQRMEVTTTDNTTVNIFAMTIPEGVILAVKARVLAAAIVGTDAALYESHALFTRYGAAAPVQVGATTASVALQDVAGAWAVALNLSGNTTRVQVNGDAGQSVHWSAMIDIETLN